MSEKAASAVMYVMILAVAAGFTFLLNRGWDDQHFYNLIAILALAIACRSFIEGGR